MSETADRRAVLDARRTLDRWNREERGRLLAGHYRVLYERRRALYAQCEAAGGHEWRPLPDNGINRPHFITGEWPHACKWCDKTRPAPSEGTEESK